MAELRAFVKEWGNDELPEEAKELQEAGWQLVAGDCLEGQDNYPYVIWVLRKPEPTFLQASENMLNAIQRDNRTGYTAEWAEAFLQWKQAIEREERKPDEA